MRQCVREILNRHLRKLSYKQIFTKITILILLLAREITAQRKDIISKIETVNIGNTPEYSHWSCSLKKSDYRSLFLGLV